MPPANPIGRFIDTDQVKSVRLYRDIEKPDLYTEELAICIMGFVTGILIIRQIWYEVNTK